jgi:hypothetical protein
VPGSLDRRGPSGAPDLPGANDRRGPDDEAARLRAAAPERDLPAVGDRSDVRDRSAFGDQPARWSKADLQQRLERLPPGHPSSLRSDDPAPDEWQPDHQPDAPKRNYWSEVPRFQQASADHMGRWPDERAAPAPDRSRDPDGSWRGDGTRYLNPEQHKQAREEITRVRETQKVLTEHIEEAKQENACGGWLEGLEYRLKGDDRIKEKAAEILKRVPGKTVENVVRELPDVIRYTFCFEVGSYAAGYGDVKDRLERQGHSMIYSKNHWRDDPEYKGINTRWVTPEGQRFELQFHTPESYHAKQEVTHRTYERLRHPLTQDEERRELRSFQREVCSWIGVPEGATAILDYLSERP